MVVGRAQGRRDRRRDGLAGGACARSSSSSASGRSSAPVPVATIPRPRPCAGWATRQTRKWRRPSGRSPDQLRRVHFTARHTKHAEGSVLVEFGDTQVLCTASVEECVPPFLRGKGKGWITAEYGMLPRATHTRSPREAARGKQSGRTLEIQRLIGRSLRAVRGPEGARRAHHHPRLRRAAGRRRHAHRRHHRRLRRAARAVRAAGQARARSARARCTGRWRRSRSASCGGVPVLDLDYAEDSQAETDMNVVMNNGGGFIEVQGTAEGHAFRRHELDALLNLAAAGHRRAVRAAGAGTRRAVKRAVLASGNAGKLRELAALLAPLDLELRTQGSLGIGRARGDRHDLPGERAAQGALCGARARSRRWRTTRDWRWTPSAHAPGCGRRASPAPARAMPRTSRTSCSELPPCPGQARTRATSASSSSSRTRTDPAPAGGPRHLGGHITAAPAGSGGFGYDPVFMPAGPSSAPPPSCPPRTRTAVSHRGQALRALDRDARGRRAIFPRHESAAGCSSSPPPRALARPLW